MSDRRNSYSFLSDGHSLVSSNGNGHKHLFTRQTDTNRSDKRKDHLKPAAFCLTVAVALIIANALGRTAKPPVPAANRFSVEDVTLTVHPYKRTREALRIAFRLSNMGKQAIFYAVHLGTDVPIGQILSQDSSSSKWTNQFAVTHNQASELVDSPIAWIEMPPGGWIHGEFEDRVKSPGDHVYAIILKPDRNGPSVRVTSAPYRYNPE